MSATRRIIRTQRLASEMGFDDPLLAMDAAAQWQRALRVIYTWAGVPGALNPEHVRKLCGEALGMDKEKQ
jgi:hypothetical protein